MNHNFRYVKRLIFISKIVQIFNILVSFGMFQDKLYKVNKLLNDFESNC